VPRTALSRLYAHPKTRPLWLRYPAALLCVGLGVAGRMALTSTVGSTSLPFLFFFPFIAVAAWYGGTGPAIVATVLAGFASSYFFFEPLYAFGLQPTELWSIGAFFLASGIIITATEVMHHSRGQLIDSHDLLSTTLASIGDGVILTDAQGRVTFLNPVAERLTRWPMREAAGRPIGDVFRVINEDTRKPVDNPVELVLRRGTTVALANHSLLIAKDGSELAVEDSGAPIQHPGGTPFGVVLVFRDVTQQRTAYEAIARLATIVESSGDAIISKNLDGIIQTWNPGAQRIFGYTASEIVGKSILTLIPPELHSQEAEILGHIRQGLPKRLETIRLTKEGRRIPVSLSVSPVRDREGRVIGASKSLHDISDILAAREQLTREKQLLATTLVSIGDGVIVTDPAGKVTMLNAEAERLTGWTDEEARGKPLQEIFRILNEDTRQPAESPVDKVLRLGSIVGLANHTVLIAKGGTETPIDDSAAPIRDRDDAPLQGVVLVFRDFTEQRNARNEILRLNSDLERRVADRTRELRETIQELETFSYTVAHDLRGPLRAMHRSAEVLLLEQASHLPAEGLDFLRRITESAERMDRLIQDLLAYSRVTRSEIKAVPVEVRMVLADLMVQLGPEIKERRAEVRIESPLGVVRADPVLLSQVFSNLLSNALKFVPTGMTPQVRILGERQQGIERIWIEDNGIGIDPRYRERLFRLFERLDSDYPGTGIGLAIVKRAVERMGGRVGFEPSRERGSRFWIELPTAGKD
jgi:PAS domain S-box-containing protein